MKGPKTDPPGGTTFDPKRAHLCAPSEIHLFALRKGLKLGPQHSESDAFLGTCLAPHSKILSWIALFESSYIHQRPRTVHPAADAVCVKVASSLTFCAHNSFNTSDKMKKPKTDPPGGTTFDPKKAHFWAPSDFCLKFRRECSVARSLIKRNMYMQLPQRSAMRLDELIAVALP